MSLPRIAVDAMGGDEGVRTMISGAALARRRHDRFKFLLVGDQARIERALEAHPNMRQASEILHCEDVVGGDEKPTQALRRAKTTSMGLAIQAVKDGRAGAAVSAGNTGALMAMAKLALRTMPGIDRPALAALMPTLEEHDVVMLDLGANTECDPRNLVQWAIMGAAYSRIVTGHEAPRVRLLNIGTEESKGTEELQEAAAQLRAATGLSLSFEGYVEADKCAVLCHPPLPSLLVRAQRPMQLFGFKEDIGRSLAPSQALPLGSTGSRPTTGGCSNSRPFAQSAKFFGHKGS